MTRDNVPRFSLSVVVIVDGVQEEILDMPAKGSELHADIHPGQRDPAYFLLFFANDSKQRSRCLVEIVQVE